MFDSEIDEWNSDVCPHSTSGGDEKRLGGCSPEEKKGSRRTHTSTAGKVNLCHLHFEE